MDNLPVLSLISHRTLKRAGFILWQFKACFLLWKMKDRETEIVNYKPFFSRRYALTSINHDHVDTLHVSAEKDWIQMSEYATRPVQAFD